MNQIIINIADALIESAKDRVSRAFTTAPPANGQYKEAKDLGRFGGFVLFLFNMMSRSLEVVAVLAGYLIALALFLCIYIVDTLYRAIMGAIKGVRERRKDAAFDRVIRKAEEDSEVQRKVLEELEELEEESRRRQKRHSNDPGFVKEEFPDHDSKDDHTYDEPIAFAPQSNG